MAGFVRKAAAGGMSSSCMRTNDVRRCRTRCSSVMSCAAVAASTSRSCTSCWRFASVSRLALARWSPSTSSARLRCVCQKSVELRVTPHRIASCSSSFVATLLSMLVSTPSCSRSSKTQATVKATGQRLGRTRPTLTTSSMNRRSVMMPLSHMIGKIALKKCPLERAL